MVPRASFFTFNKISESLKVLHCDNLDVFEKLQHFSLSNLVWNDSRGEVKRGTEDIKESSRLVGNMWLRRYFFDFWLSNCDVYPWLGNFL